LALGEIADGLTRRGRLVGARAEDAPPQHRSMRASLDWSYELLDDADRRLFRSLSVFSGGWDTPAAEAVALAEGDGTQMTGRLAGLERKGLVVAQAFGEETRWSLLQAVGDYAAERLAEDPVEQAMVRDRHLAWYGAFAATVDELLIIPAGHAVIDRESLNLRLAFEAFVPHRSRRRRRDGEVAVAVLDPGREFRRGPRRYRPLA
jgi:predicted ATPase